MAKFCKHCGSKLDESTGLCPVCDAKRKSGHIVLKIFMILILVIILVIGTAGILAYFEVMDVPILTDFMTQTGLIGNMYEFDASASHFECMDGSFTTRLIQDEKTALEAINDGKNLIGITDPTQELGKCHVDSVLENQYFRFPQEYQGIPVYGRSVTISADAEGKCLMLTGNYANLGKVTTNIKIEESKAIELMAEYFGNEMAIDSQGLTIYSLGTEKPEIAWQLLVSNAEIREICFVSATTGEVIKEISDVYIERVVASGEDIDGVNQDFFVEYSDKTYTLEDTDRGISVYDAHNSTLQKEIVILDSNGHVYCVKNDEFVNESGEVVDIEGENYSFVIKDGNGNVIGTDGEYAVRMKTANIFTNLTPVTSKSNTWSEKKAVTLMARLSSIYDFWVSRYHRYGYDGKHGEMIAVYDDYKRVNWLLGDTQNAESWGGHGIPLTVLSFGIDNSLANDVIGHEYMHSVERSISGMVYERESGAIMEAYSDIFGEIMEDWCDDGVLNNSCDWMFDTTLRNIIDPTQSSCPNTYHGNHWADTSDTDRDHGGVHTNNTVISHAAYLMWTGIRHRPDFEPLSTQDISDLFYTALEHVPADCTMKQLKTILINNAEILYKQGRLTNKKCLCVAEAFKQVGLDSENMTYTVSNNFELNVYDIQGQLYDNYSLTIEQVDVENIPQGPMTSAKTTKISTNNVQSAEPYPITLNPGVYRMLISDLSNKKDTKSFYITVLPNGETSLAIFTLFGKSVNNLAENVKGDFKSADIPSGAVEFNGHYYYLYDGGIASTYDEALQFCKSKNGYLATLTSKEENEFVYSYMCGRNCSSAYFGLSDAENEGIWEWCTGEEVSYLNWHSGEPNGENSNEDYGLFYYKYADGTWNDGDFGKSTVNDGTAFICEWGTYTTKQKEEATTKKTVSGDRNIVLTLDVSGSMSGDPIGETKKASSSFVNTVLEKDASIGIVTYEDEAECKSDFSVSKSALQNIISQINGGGGTNIEDGLRKAQNMLRENDAKKKIIVLMSDGEPNEGKEGEELIAYANEIKQEGTLIYTLGFFESLGEKSSAQRIMEKIASDGCHYEVASADDLVFFFEDMADQINGQKYIYVRIACPVDVSVTYNGQTLSSAENNPNFRTDFGTLTFEENEESISENQDDRIKVLRLKEGADYDLAIEGNGRGIMNYTIGFMDEEGDYTDLRKFENIKITKKTKIDTVAAVSSESILNIDENGDGTYDLRLRAEENGYGEEIKIPEWILYAIIGAGILVTIDIIILVVLRKKKKKGGK